ncbi:hypothetical protein LS684_02610 [Cytobacillus spongiae]|uniref:alpha/beta hydrolase family protein n=1 Tax=Cytobacillus spongiae TaxID=2901381 RepID=UPI001F1ABAFB|nr:hypothetical protein [Cytobacillus spongiae]UII56398.1 hypothetical protein LS684_02610 [Cytobacillus spongiae]
MRTPFLVKKIPWVKSRFALIPERDGTYSVFLILTLLIATMVAAVVQALGNPTGATLFSRAVDLGLAVTLNGWLFGLFTFILAFFLTCLHAPVPRLLLGSFGYTTTGIITILLIEKAGIIFSIFIGISYSIVTICIGLLLIFSYKLIKKRGGMLLIALLSSAICSFVFFENGKEKKPQQISQQSFNIEDPSKMGGYDYSFLTYGSGSDRYRPEFAENVDVVTPSVDASTYITKWGKNREAFWGFGPDQLPINGRVWVPKGKGPFPILIIVHGNHTMEDFSTSGYDYLGEHLASRGFITISVDEDFLNHSNISGTPNDDHKMRAWMLLQHLVHLKNMNHTDESPLYRKMDLQQIALIGHSRGGQAAAIAADANRFFKDDDLLSKLDDIEVQAVIGLAPTDVRIDGKRPSLHDISYLLLHGARDGDVNDYPGEQQFNRVYFRNSSTDFKAALYIEDANHSQFNSTWGRMDTSIPKGLFLSQREIMDPEEQRQVAKVYISAFVEVIFHGNTSYKKLFRDYRYGANWLPNTIFINQYQNSTYSPILQFRQNRSVFSEGLRSTHQGFEEVKVTTPPGKDASANALFLNWKATAEYSIHLPKGFLIKRSQQNLVLTMANMIWTGEQETHPNIQIELETDDGTKVQLSLDSFMPFPPVIMTNYTHFGWFDPIFRGDQYKQSWEPIYQTFELPLKSFKKELPEMDWKNVTTISLHFSSSKGKVLVKEIGFGN